MSNDDNKRINDRLHAFWKIYKDDITWGYLIDLSETGLKIWLNKEEEVNEDDFTIKIHPPKELENEELDFDIHRVWMNPNKSMRFNELGCQFRNLNDNKIDQLRELILYFKKYNKKGKV